MHISTSIESLLLEKSNSNYTYNMSYELISYTEELGYEESDELLNEYELDFDASSSFDADDYEYQQDLASGVFTHSYK
jgi:hypothetical protein